MYASGIDIGSRATKVVIINEDGVVLGRGLRLTGGKPVLAAEQAYEEAMLSVHLTVDEITASASTGYGRRLISKDTLQYTSVSCHAAGAYHVLPGTRNVLDVGALRSTAIRLDETGQVHRFRLNDRCGAGIGRFLERIADTLELPLEEIGQLALFSRNPQSIPSVCSVLAEAEVMNHITHEDNPSDILRGVYEALADRIASMMKQVMVPEGEITMTGGVAKNAGMARAIEEALGRPLKIHHDAEFIGAIGAALLAAESAGRKILSHAGA